MHGNPVKEAVLRGEPQFGTWINMVRNPAILPLLKAAGLDFARVDMEHSSIDMESMADMALLARAIDFPIFVRPPEANREWITRLLDAGVWNLHCPQVDTADHAAAIVQAAYYAPMGSRGQAGGGPATDFETGVSMADRMAYANSQVFVTVMLETASAFDHLDAIAAMPGIDALTLGPTDLAQDLGVYGTPDEGRVLDERRQMLIDAARRHGKTTAMLVNSAEQARQWKEAGVMLLGYSSEVGVLQQGYRRALREIKGD
jgi:2-keto-3-deoxy-L-rhamnonate aldolase RhmA